MKNKTGKVTVFLFILVFLLLVFSPIVNAQTPTPPTRDSLIQAIQQRAQKDVELGASPQSPSDLAVLFSEQAAAVGMSMSDVKDIYDEAYKAAKPANSPWDDLLKPQGGWIFLIVGALLVILGNMAKDYLTTVFKKLAEASYQRLARFRPFWMIALRRYRKSLEAAYRELKIPFRQGRPLQMRDVYVPVRVDGGDKQQVDAYQTIQKQKRLVVLGDPGSGKTMFLRHVTFTYATQGLHDFPGRPIPVYLELNRVESVGNSLLTALAKTLENHNFPSAEGFIKSALESGLLIILLDGLDEVNTSARPALIDQIQDLWQKYPDNRIIVTCRKAVYQGELDIWIDQKLEIIEFSDQQIQRFMTSWQKDMPVEKSIEHFFRTLQERPQIMALARNPLLLTMVAYLYTDTEFALPHSRSEFYSRSTDLLLDQWKLERNRYKASHKRTILQKLALFNQSQAGQTGERRTLELADVLREIRNVLPDLTLKTEDAQPLLDEIVQRSGLMLAIDGGTRYQFTHLTLQEYFAARALEASQEKLLDFYRMNPDAWREVMRLWCALEHSSTAMLKEIYTLDPVMAFECLSDAQQVDNAYADELIQGFQPRLHEALNNDFLASAFALLAANQNSPRGRKWFEYVKENLNDEGNRLAACTVLARTNIPQAAEPLSKLATTDPDVITFLVQLGNLAVPALTELTQNGEIWAMDALVDIGTPQAALVLEPLLWTEESKAYHAAWRLAALLSLPGVEDALKTADLTPDQLRAKQIEWVWEPFSDNMNLRAITGKLAHLLHSTPGNELPDKKLPCAPRLALTMCAVVENIYESLDEGKLKKLREKIMEEENSSPVINNLELRHPFLGEEKQKIIVADFLNQIEEKQVLKRIYNTLPTVQQFDLLYRLVFGKEYPTEDDWRNLFKPISYDFSTSWHVKILKLLLFLLLPINLWGVWNQIDYSTLIFTWRNVGAVFIGIVLLIGMIWAQRQTWTVGRIEGFAFIVFLGIGGLCGALTGELIHNWVMSTLGGVLGVILWGVLFMSMDKGMSLPYARFIIVTTLIIGALVGILSSILVNALAGNLIVAISVTLLLILLKIIKKDLLDNIKTGALFIIPWSSLLDIFLMRYATELIYDLAGLFIVVLFWLVWLGSLFILYLIGKRLERRAQNPLHGLLEPSDTIVALRHSFSLFRRWLWLK